MRTPDGKIELVVGVGATMVVGSDRYPYTVVEISTSGKTIKVVKDIFMPGEGHDYYGTQVWVYTQTTSQAARDNSKIARWSAKMGCYQIGGIRLYVGKREAHIDPSF